MAESFGRYEILDRIGVGGMAEVYRARAFGAEGFQKTLVLKKILPHLSDDPHFQSMFVDEAKIAVALQHQNVVQILDLGRIDHQLFIAMELVDGADLARTFIQARSRGIPWPQDVVFFIAKEALKGLHYAHTKLGADNHPLGVIHRDVSPANILLSFAGEVKIGDFGIAKAAEKSHTTRTGLVKGKIHYMSPEQLEGRPLDPRADVFGMGMVLHTLISGAHPLDNLQEVQVIDTIRHGVIPKPSELNPDISPELDALVMRAIEKDPARRYESAEAMGTAIEAYAQRNGMYLDGKSLAPFLRRVFEGTGLMRGSAARAQEAASAEASMVRAAVAAPSAEGLTILRTGSRGSQPDALRTGTDQVPRRSTTPPWLPLAAIGGAVIATIASVTILVGLSGHRGVSKAPTPTPTTRALTPSGNRGVLDFDVSPWAQVWIDGETRGSTPLVMQLDPGTHHLEYETPDGARHQRTVEIVRGETNTVRLGF